MSEYYLQLQQQIEQSLADYTISSQVALSELSIIINKDDLLAIAEILKEDENLQFDTLVDICGVDYSEYQGVQDHPSRFASVYHLQSIALNHRIRLTAYLDDDLPMIDSVVRLWSAANWYEREAFDLFGILYQGHPDLRRILTDYGFIGHPLRKDFPVIGNVEMRYDHELKRVVYEPVSIENRVIIPRVVRHDHRYEDERENRD